jgi:hypothetical protein
MSNIDRDELRMIGEVDPAPTQAELDARTKKWSDKLRAAELDATPPAGAGEAVAWRVLIGDSDTPGYCAEEWQADFYGKQSGLRYTKTPLYAAPTPLPEAVRELHCAVKRYTNFYMNGDKKDALGEYHALLSAQEKFDAALRAIPAQAQRKENAAVPDSIRDKLSDGWRVEWEPQTEFIGLRHPDGGRMSVARIYGFPGVGEYIAAMLDAATPPEGAAQGREDAAEPMYYLQDARQYVGNCPLWWGKNGAGYTTRLDLAARYTLAEAMARTRPTDKPWPCAQIDAIQRPTVDMQDMRRLPPDAALATQPTPAGGST